MGILSKTLHLSCHGSSTVGRSVGLADIKANCNFNNKPKSCTCTNGDTWTSNFPDTKPCGGKRNVDECTCKDGETYSGIAILANCVLNSENPLVSCLCKDDTTWTNSS